ncbi:MAG: hypothetical protein GXY14_05890 [Spirochaetes bacterium]|nr:hypothetical protein [Spirochaetota bacterium]
MVLILFSPVLRALPLTRTLYIAPPDFIDFSVSVDYLFAARQITRERFAACTGLWNGASIAVSFDVLGMGVIGREKPGDSSFELIASINPLTSDRVRTAFYCSILLPTGPDAYIREDYRAAAFGRNEISVGPLMAFDFRNDLAGFLNFIYTFREGESGGFYSGFRIDPSESGTYRSLLGLNPFCCDSFMYYKKMSDDYVTLASAAVYSGLFPLVTFLEMRSSLTVAVSGGGDVPDAARSGVNPFIAGAGLKYFIVDSFFAQIYGAINPVRESGGVRWRTGLLFNLIF